ncbi:unnamed protein product, partial [Effrenium voratum]
PAQHSKMRNQEPAPPNSNFFHVQNPKYCPKSSGWGVEGDQSDQHLHPHRGALVLPGPSARGVHGLQGEGEITTDIEDAIAKYNEATARLAEAEKNKAQADQVVKEINDSISKDIKEFQANLESQAKKTKAIQDAANDKSLKELEQRTQERLEAYIDSQAVERGLKELKGLKPNQKQKFMDAAIASL